MLEEELAKIAEQNGYGADIDPGSAADTVAEELSERTGTAGDVDVKPAEEPESTGVNSDEAVEADHKEDIEKFVPAENIDETLRNSIIVDRFGESTKGLFGVFPQNSVVDVFGDEKMSAIAEVSLDVVKEADISDNLFDKYADSITEMEKDLDVDPEETLNHYINRYIDTQQLADADNDTQYNQSIAA